MTNKELMDALAQAQKSVQTANAQITQAQVNLNDARFKLDAIASQVMENLRTTGQALPAAAAPATAAQPSAALAPAAAGDTVPGASLEFDDVPQSAASRIEPTRVIVPLKEPRSVAAASTAAAPAAPTRESPAGPTVERPRPAMDPEQRKAEQLGHFRGTGSLFARFLSPEIITAGKGMIKPFVPPSLQQYSEDAQLTPVQHLAKWPSGFYRSRSTSQVQLFIDTPGILVLVPELNQAHLKFPLVAIKPVLPTSTWQSIEEIDVMDILLLRGFLETELKKFSDEIVVPTT